jgi:hypothetical protein
MNKLAHSVFQIVPRGKQLEGCEMALLNVEEKAALSAVLPLIQRTPEWLEKFLDKDGVPEDWMTPLKTVFTSAK